MTSTGGEKNLHFLTQPLKGDYFLVCLLLFNNKRNTFGLWIRKTNKKNTSSQIYQHFIDQTTN